VQQAFVLGKLFHHAPAPLRVVRDAVLDRTPFLQKVVGESSPGEIIAQLAAIDAAEKRFAEIRALGHSALRSARHHGGVNADDLLCGRLPDGARDGVDLRAVLAARAARVHAAHRVARGRADADDLVAAERCEHPD
jgi:hypothetical protein